MDWREMELFRGIDLNDSFVLGWQLEGDRLVFDLEISVWPESTHYYTPKDRKAALVFQGTECIQGLVSMSEARSSTDASGEVDYGNIDELRVRPDGASIVGDFGTVEIAGGICALSINT